jgi:hypothetical protein
VRNPTRGTLFTYAHYPARLSVDDDPVKINPATECIQSG